MKNYTVPDSMWLLVDDVRDLNTDAIARTYDAGMKLIALGGWECVCFDHDLGEKDDKKNGYTLLTWALENNFLPNRVQLVTGNPIGREKMTLALLNGGYTRLPDGATFIK